QLSSRRDVQQLVIRDAAPEEERQPGRELDVADLERRAARESGWLAFDAEKKLRADEQPLERALDARVEARLVAALVKEGQQVAKIGVARRPSIRESRQREQDLSCASSIVLRAAEDASPA